MSLMILECMHIFSWQAHLVKKGTFLKYPHILLHVLLVIIETLMTGYVYHIPCDIEISGKTQNYRLKSVCNFKVIRFYLILLCKQNNWTLDTYSVEIIYKILL